MVSCKVSVTLDPPQDIADSLFQGIRQHNIDSDYGQQLLKGKFAALVHNDTGALVGGAYCLQKGNWVYIEYLWVDKPARGLGLGIKLVEAVIAEAHERQCAGIHLVTFTYQALDFYKNRGFQEFARIEDYPPGHARVYLRMDLTA